MKIMRMRRTHLRRPALAALAAGWAWLAASGCGNVTAGGFTEVRVDVSGDAQSPAPSPEPSMQPAWPASGAPARSSHENQPEGEIEVDFRLTLISARGGAFPLGDDDIRVKVELDGSNEAEAVSELVPADRYTELQVAFTHIQVEVRGGLVINGTPIVGEVRVELEDPSLLVSRPLDLDAPDGSSVTMVVDLNTPAWLEALDPVTKTVDPAVFASLIDVVVR